MKKRITFGIILVVFIISACESNFRKQNNETDVNDVAYLVDSFFERINEDMQTDDQINDIFQMIHYEIHDEQFDTVRKDSFRNSDMKGHVVNNIEMLHPNIYCIETSKATSKNEKETKIFYVVKIDKEWKLCFGIHNIPRDITETLQSKNIEIPVTPVPEDVEVYSLNDIIF